MKAIPPSYGRLSRGALENSGVSSGEEGATRLEILLVAPPLPHLNKNIGYRRAPKPLMLDAVGKWVTRPKLCKLP